ncbi:MAG: hypothetical protein KUL75_03695 [Sterolibacterium sp.]|nr:hypothetical protein [Sterolibacterium sp.]
MTKLLHALLVAALIPAAAFAADETNADAAKEAVKAPAVGELVTPANDAAALRELIAQSKAESDAAKAKAAAGK